VNYFVVTKEMIKLIEDYAFQNFWKKRRKSYRSKWGEGGRIGNFRKRQNGGMFLGRRENSLS